MYLPSILTKPGATKLEMLVAYAIFKCLSFDGAEKNIKKKYIRAIYCTNIEWCRNNSSISQSQHAMYKHCQCILLIGCYHPLFVYLAGLTN